MRFFQRLLEPLISAMGLVGLICVTLMMLHVTTDVLLRFVFNLPIGGTITIVSNYYMVILGFGSLAVAESRGAHVSVEVLTELMPRNVQTGLASMAALLGAVVFGFLTVRTWIEAMAKMELGAAMQQGTMTIPVWPSYFALPLGCGLMVLTSLWRAGALATGAPSTFGPDMSDLENYGDPKDE
ncbi:TRAP transporter small permease [Sulfitobacter sp. F26169L]|uniref:TRAP transporter small permease n=1 Tax=Sulfitobacter sp. F26169L TaxID=2996015 RepID=UPI002260E5B7|nr:TRAP transporter small permease [Sulfitobacter sp. F26169L]MCX7567919.1 TRAP transporter small permease [Sulfitobacter sp. F26169L]